MAYRPEFISAVEEAQKQELSELRNEVCENMREISRLKSEVQTVTAERDRQYDENVHRIAEQARVEGERDQLLSDAVDNADAWDVLAAKNAEIARLTADLDWLKRSIFGSANYQPVPTGYFAEMAQTTEAARKGALERAEKAEAEAERDTARAETAMMVEVAADHCWNKRDLLADAEKKQVEAGLTGRDYYGRRLEAELLSRSIRALTPSHATAALASRDKATRGQALMEAASIPYDPKFGNDWLGMTAAILTLIDEEKSQ